MRRILGSRPSPAMAVAFVALLAALSGTATALQGKNTVDSGDLKNGQVKKDDIGKNAVNGKKVKDGSLASADVKNGGLTGADVKDASLTPSDFSGSVQGPKGDKGDKGDTGDAGTAVAYANVLANGTLETTEPGINKNISDANVRHTPASGVYCFHDLPFTVKNAQVSADNSFAQNDTLASVAVSTDPAETLGGCEQVDRVRVRTYDVSAAALQDQRFLIWFED
jgi:hypothetical protein